MLAGAAAALLLGLIAGGGGAYLLIRHFGLTTAPPVIVHSVTKSPSGGSSVAAIAANISPAVVQVVRESAAATPPIPADVSSGFLVGSTGVVVTSEGAVDGASGLAVLLNSGQVLPATVAGSDPATGVVLLQVSGSNLPSGLSFGSPPSLGDAVVAVSHPYGSGLNVDIGTVSQVAMTVTVPDSAAKGGSATIDGVAQVNFAEPLGSSGGPLVNSAGQVVGVMAGQPMQPTDQGANAGALGFALDASDSQAMVSSLSELGTLPAPVGVVARLLDPSSAAALGLPAGAQVVSVVAGSAAATSGLLPGDVVTAVNGKAVEAAGRAPAYPSLADLLRSYGAGASVTLTIYRASVQHQLSLTLPSA